MGEGLCCVIWGTPIKEIGDEMKSKIIIYTVTTTVQHETDDEWRKEVRGLRALLKVEITKNPKMRATKIESREE